MATITEAGTLGPDVQLWKTPMRPDNTPVVPGTPIGRVTWFESFNTAAVTIGNIVELALAVTMPLNQYAFRLMNVQWQAQITDAGATGDIQDWSDRALLTVPTEDEVISYNLTKAATATQATITNQFASDIYVPSPEGVGVLEQTRDPFIPLSPMIFRVVNVSTNASAVTTWFSHMWAHIYTIEQYEQAAIWMPTKI